MLRRVFGVYVICVEQLPVPRNSTVDVLLSDTSDGSIYPLRPIYSAGVREGRPIYVIPPRALDGFPDVGTALYSVKKVV